MLNFDTKHKQQPKENENLRTKHKFSFYLRLSLFIYATAIVADMQCGTI